MISEVSMPEIPLDIQPQFLLQWFNIIRRIQSVSKNGNNGIAIVNMRIVVDQDGRPRLWTEPTVTRLEPKRSSDDIIRLLVGE